MHKGFFVSGMAIPFIMTEPRTGMLSNRSDKMPSVNNAIYSKSYHRHEYIISQTCCCAGLPSLLLSSPCASSVSSFPPIAGRQSASQPWEFENVAKVWFRCKNLSLLLFNLHSGQFAAFDSQAITQASWNEWQQGRVIRLRLLLVNVML